jgi:hypothetical protein
MTIRIRPTALWPLVGLLAGLLGACTAPGTPVPSVTPAPTATPFAPQQLRVKNGGTTEIKGLVVGFAVTGRPVDHIAFGDVQPGATTEYQTVPNGVLEFAAYTFQMDDRLVDQPVVDFMGMQPLPGSAFTYVIDYDPARYSQNQAIKLLNVSTDVAAIGPTPTPQPSGFDAQVELDVFSGRPNPTWALSEADINTFQKKLGTLPTTAAQPYPDQLGYRGLVVTLTDRASGKPAMVWRVSGGVAQIAAGTAHDYYADADQGLESWLLETGQPFLPADLFASVQADRLHPPQP